MDAWLATVQRRLGVTIQDLDSLAHAFHTDMYHQQLHPQDNSRQLLEGIGDKALGLALAAHMRQYGSIRLSTTVANQVGSNEWLKLTAEHCGFAPYLKWTPDRRLSEREKHHHPLANTLEIIIGLLFEEHQWEGVMALSQRIFYPVCDFVVNQPPQDRDVVERLLFLVGKTNPTKKLEAVCDGPRPRSSALPRWTVQWQIETLVLGQGTGKTQEEAKAKGAEAALHQHFPDQARILTPAQIIAQVLPPVY